MKRQLILLLVAASLAACKSGVIAPAALTSFNITNAVIGGNTLTLNNTGLDIGNGSYTPCTLYAGQTAIQLGDTSLKPQAVYYNKTTATVNGSYYSLFLTGNSPSQVDDVLIEDSYQNYADSVSGVRFINLSPGSTPISVNIAGQANGSEVSSLAYLSYTTFKKYTVSATLKTYQFEFRNATTGTLITDFTLTAPAFKNTTLALAGTTSNPNIIQINQF